MCIYSQCGVIALFFILLYIQPKDVFVCSSVWRQSYKDMQAMQRRHSPKKNKQQQQSVRAVSWCDSAWNQRRAPTVKPGNKEIRRRVWSICEVFVRVETLSEMHFKSLSVIRFCFIYISSHLNVKFLKKSKKKKDTYSQSLYSAD